MAQLFLTPIDLNKNELRNGVIQNLASAPSSPVAGQVYYDTTTGSAYFYSGGLSAWVPYDAKLRGLAASDISNFNTAVQANRLDQMAAPTSAVSLNSQRITNLADPSSATSQDAATANWVTTQVANAKAGLDVKDSVRFTTTGNVTLSGLGTQAGGDWGGALTAGDRILVKNNTTGSQNGIYVAASGSWTRASDATQGNLTSESFVFVEEGTTLGTTQWRVTTTGAITVGTTSITWAQFGAGTSYTAGNGIDIAGNTISAKVVSGGNLTNGASGLDVDTAKIPRKYSASVGNGSLTSITVTHNLGTQDVMVFLRQAASPYAQVFTDVQVTDANNVTFLFSSAPSSNQYRATIIG